jgi:hypothetical protein
MIYLPPPSAANVTARAVIELRQHDREQLESIDQTTVEMSRVEGVTNDQEQKERGYMATIGVGTSALQSANIAQGQVHQVQQGFRSTEAKAEVSDNLSASRTGRRPAGKLGDVQLTDKTKLGDRFNDAQQALLTRGTFTDGELAAARFTKPEQDELRALRAKNGGKPLSVDQAADFIVRHRDGPLDAIAKQAQAGQGEAIKQLCAAPDRVLGGARQLTQQSAKRYGEIKGTTVGLREQMSESAAQTRENGRAIASAATGNRT